MALVQNTNITALIAQRRLAVSSQTLQKSMERLSSGYRINRTADDAAGLTISQNLISQINRMKQASQNTQDGIGVLQVAEGALSVMGDNLQRIRELTVQASNDTTDPNGRAAINAEIQALLKDIDRISASTNFNGINLLDNSPKPEAYIQIGPNSSATSNVVDIGPALLDSSSTGLGVVGGTQTFANVAAINLSNNATSRQFLADVDSAIRTVNLRRSTVGSYQSQLESVDSNLQMAIENFSTSNSRIRDVDVAAESATMTQYQTLTQAATMVLSQTNQLPQMILGLLKQ